MTRFLIATDGLISMVITENKQNVGRFVTLIWAYHPDSIRGSGYTHTQHNQQRARSETGNSAVQTSLPSGNTRCIVLCGTQGDRCFRQCFTCHPEA
jgi:hypothetical protein